jgi:hypothetical protein
LPIIKKNALWQPICAQIGYDHKAVVMRQSLLMLMTILAQTFFTFVGRHLMSFVLFTVWHNCKLFIVIIL